MATYDPIMNALLAYLKAQIGTSTFLTFQRGVMQWSQLGRADSSGNPLLRQPALFLYDGVGFGGGKTRYERLGRAQPAVRIMSRTIVIYAKTPVAGGFPSGLGGSAIQNLTTSQATILHPLVEAVETALATPDNASLGTLTLGGLVAYCRIEGDGFIISPDVDSEGQGMATLPVEIKVP